MFENVITLYPEDDGTNSSTVNLVDVDNGRSVRQVHLGSGAFERFTVSHTTTKENPTVQTARHLVRVERVEPDSLDPKKNVTAFAQLVIGQPLGGPISDAELLAMVRKLLFFFLCGSGSADPDTELGSDATPLQSAYDNVVQQLLNGEV